MPKALIYLKRRRDTAGPPGRHGRSTSGGVGRDLQCAGAEATSSAVETPNHVLLEFLARTLGSVGHGMLAGLRRVEAHRSGARRGTDLQKQVYGMSEVRDLWKDRPKQQ